MVDLFNNYKNKIDRQGVILNNELLKIKLPWSKNFFFDLLNSNQKGKTIRGSLVLLAVEMFNYKLSPDALNLALALEYNHTALLIHDDIMDHDDLRRGTPSAHYKYKLLAEKNQAKDPADFGISQAICLGDAAIFISYFILSKIKNLSPLKYSQLLNLVSHEFIKVGLGQAEDLQFSHYETDPSAEEVIHMYTHKTARYTFSLPLMAGAILANRPKKDIKILEKIGVSLGLIFQLSDDNLSLNGDSKQTGKAIGNDIKTDKKTYYRILLQEKASELDKQIILKIFRKGSVDQKDINVIKNLIIKYKVDTSIDRLINHHIKQAQKNFKKLNTDEKHNKFLNEFIIFLENRKS